MTPGKAAARLALALAAAIAMSALSLAAAFAAQPVPEVTADGALLMDAATGEILMSKNMHKQKYPASTTKVMTALLAIESLDLDELVTIDAEAPFTKGARIYLIEGELLSVRELLYALLVESANDAAVALANRISGGAEAFAELMNKRAKELGALNTHFVNPNGLENEEHLTTAYDLAMIAREAMKNEVFREIVGTYTHTIPATNKQPEERYLHNTNRLLYDTAHHIPYEGVSRVIKYDDAIGIKTGHTSQAGTCLIAGARRDGTELIAVMLQTDGNNIYLDAISLLEYGFANFKTVMAVKSGLTAGAIKVKSGEVNQVETRVDGDAWVTLPADASWSDIEKVTEFEPFLTAPVAEGQKAGTMTIRYKGEDLISLDVVASSPVGEGGVLSRVGVEDSAARTIRNVILSALAILLALLTAYVLVKRRQVKLRRRRRAERAARIAEEAGQIKDMRRM